MKEELTKEEMKEALKKILNQVEEFGDEMMGFGKRLNEFGEQLKRKERKAKK